MSLDQIVKNVKNKKSYKIRLEALKELSKLDNQIANDIILKVAQTDRVFIVKETAFRIAESKGLSKGAKPLMLGKKDTGYKMGDFKKAAQLIRRRKKMNEFDLELFKTIFKDKNAEMYDVMQYDKGENFDAWLEEIFNNASKK